MSVPVPAFARPLVAFSRILALAAAVLAASAMVLMIALVLWAVVARFTGLAAPGWLEECAGFLFLWIVFVGGALGVYRDTNPAVTIVMDRLPERLRGDLRIVADVSTLAYAAILVQYGIVFVNSVKAITAPGSGISMALVDASLLVAAVLMLVFSLSRIAAETAWNARRAGVALVTAAVWFAVLEHHVALSPSLLFTTMILGLLVLLLLGVPVAFAIGMGTLLAVSTSTTIPLLLMPQNMVAGLNNFILLAVPFFLVVGAIMAAGSSSLRLLGVANALVGWIRGGIGLADIVASAIFADISGSAIADSAAIGSVITPELTRQGFKPEFATALQAAAGSLGILFPPSVTMILYAWVANVSVAQLFLSLFVPGLIVTLSFMLLVYVTAVREQLPAAYPWSWRGLGRSIARGWGPLIMPGFILGGILAGFATPTESGVLAVVFAAFLSSVLYREISPRRYFELLVDSALMTGRIGLIIASSRALGWVMIANQGPQHVLDLLLKVAHDSATMLVLVNLFMILVHTVIEAATTILVVVPLLLPALVQYNVDPLQFGVLLNINSAIGLILPPAGICLYIACSMTKVSVEKAARFAIPFALVLGADLTLMLFVPQITSFLPSLFPK